MPRRKSNDAGEVVKIKRYTCGGCGEVRYQDPDQDEPPEGYHGSVSLIGPRGGSGRAFYACSEGCVFKAVIKATDPPNLNLEN